MPSFRGLLLLAGAGTALAQLNFETDATLHDYPSLADGRAKYNPPWCEMSYDSLDLNSITSYCAIDKSTCGACFNVCGSKGCKYLLAMDQCSRTDGLLDMSVGAGQEIGGATTGHLQVKVTQVDASNCAHIWNGQMFFSWEAPYGGLATLKSLMDGEATTVNYVASSTSVPVLTSSESSSTLATATSSAEAEPVSEASVSKETEATSVYSASADPAVTSEYSSTVAEPKATSEDPAPVETASLSVETSPSYSIFETSKTVHSEATASNEPGSTPAATLLSSSAPFSNSSIAATASSSASAAIPTDDGSDSGTDVSAESNGSGGPTTTRSEQSVSESEDCVTVTSTVPGSTIYYTVTSGHSSSKATAQSPSSTAVSILAEIAASDSTTKATTTIRSTSTVWYTQTTTITGCPSGVTNCPESLRTTGTSTLTSAVQTTVVASAYATLYPSGPGHWNGTGMDGSHDAVDIPHAEASSHAYAAEVKENHKMVAPFTHAKRSSAPASAGGQGSKVIMALGGLTALIIMAL
ncbi:hypothetical protein SLS55_006577 [Diplodia seriata]|uniref:Uncharacterized protein n=1 Tax=Diplodia seriata TaxID=420778 RepID=A0ABR3CEL7_9PEZI